MATRRRSAAGRTSSADPSRARVLVLHGPNLNLLGTGDPDLYGRETLSEVDARLVAEGARVGIQVGCFQSNYEGALVERVHAARAEGVAYIVVNAAALAYTSVALRDALVGVSIPFVEVHLSNVHTRERFRAGSFLAEKAVGAIVGLGSRGYDFALAYALAQLRE